MMQFQFKGKFVLFATNNINKFNEARAIFKEYNLALGMLKIKTFELQSENLEEIAAESVKKAFEICNLPVMVEDAGLFIKALNGFPGPYSSFVYKTLGNKGLLQLMKNVEDRYAVFKSALAFFSEDFNSPVCFKGEVFGKITELESKKKSEASFGFDPIFKPAEIDKTFSELSILEKNRYSHRGIVLREFVGWYKKLNSVNQ